MYLCAASVMALAVACRKIAETLLVVLFCIRSSSVLYKIMWFCCHSFLSASEYTCLISELMSEWVSWWVMIDQASEWVSEWVYMYAFVYTCPSIHIYMHICMHACMCACIHVVTCVCYLCVCDWHSSIQNFIHCSCICVIDGINFVQDKKKKLDKTKGVSKSNLSQ